jgi:hypothetical protein
VKTTHYILFAHGSAWQIATVTGGGGHVAFVDVDVPEQGPAAAIAQRLSRELRRIGYTGQGVLLALASEQCLAAPIDTTGLPRGDRKAMLYRLEEKLPVAAEAVVADFIPSGDHALGVCVREDAVAPLVHALESAGVAVQSVSPAALLTARQMVAAGGSQVLLIGEGDDQVNVIVIRDAAPVSWSLLPARLSDVKLHLDVLALESGQELGPIRSCEMDAALATALAAEPIPAPAPQAAAVAAAAALDGRRDPWIELRRGAMAISDPLRLHRKPLDAVLVAAAVFLVCLAIGLLWRGHRYATAAATADRAVADEFQKAFPGWSLPANVRTVVESEHRKLAAQGSSGLPIESTESALQTLHAALSKLPSDLKFTMERMGFFDETFELAGRARTSADVDTLAVAAAQSGFEVALPERHRDAEGYWSFTVRGRRRPAAGGRTSAPLAQRPEQDVTR